MSLIIIPLYVAAAHAPYHLDFSKTSVIGVRFDPSYYYNLKQSVPRFVDSTVELWSQCGINCVFFMGYDPHYGAFYKTTYPCNIMGDYGKIDLMGEFIRVCHAHGIRFFVWLWPFEHGEAWNRHPEWRIKKEDGSDLLPGQKSQYLCVRNAQCRQWWRGFVGDILKNYPDIDGIDLAEPGVVWEEHETCACSICSREIAGAAPVRRKLRADGLTLALGETITILRSAGKKCCLTFTATTEKNGSLLPFKKQIALTGLDLDSLLASRSVPDWVSVEVMWQQWADEHKNSRRFTPAWTARAISQALRRITGRALLLAHVELSSFGNARVTKDGFLQSIVAARKSGAYALEFYDSHLADSIGIWRELKAAVNTRPDRRVLLLYDTVSYAESKAVAALCGHFDIDVVLLSVNKFRGFLVRPTDCIIYIGCDQESSVPEEFLRFAEKTPVPLFWLHANLNQLLSRSVMLSDSLGFTLKTSAENTIVRSIEYKGKKFFYSDSSCIALSIVDSGRVAQHAIAQTAAGEKQPYIVQSGNFWYLADYTLGFDIGDRHVIFADVLHDFLSEDHVRRHCALVRIEDVTTRTDPRQIRELADYFYKNGIPWSIALVPFYVDPDRNINESLSEAPVLTAALHFAISHGAAIVEHGVTHQYRGHSTDDFEFWDLQNERPLIEDSREFVAARLQKGLSEMHACGLYPVVFETPHYGASPLDYSVFDEFFSTEYGRRDQPDACGAVAPFYISHHPTGCRLIPENCGYVSATNADVKSILAAGENLLAVRDGMASFFFHPWIDIGALKQIVDKLRAEGYEFIDIRDGACCVRSSLFSQYTGSGEARLNLNGRFLHTFCIDESGEKANERYSSQGLFIDTAFHDVCPSGRIFVAEGVVDRPSPLSFVKLPNLGIRKLFKAWTAPKPPLTLRGGAAARVEILWTGDSAASADRYHATQYAWKKSFESCGIPVSLVETRDFTDLPPQCNLAVVPSAAARRLTAQQTSELMRLVMAGTNIIVECPSPLSDSLGFHAQSPVVEIDSVADVNYPQTIFAWKPAEMVMPLDTHTQYTSRYVAKNQIPVVVSADRGRGRVLYFAAHVSCVGNREPARFLFFPDLLKRVFNLYPVARSPVVEIYFEPTSRSFISEQSIVEQWRRDGVNTVYVALNECARPDNVDYGHFVDVLHHCGIAAYCWISFPQVSPEFLEKYPQWRSPFAAQGAAGSRRTNTADFLNATCLSRLLESARVFLSLAQWDGINWTESPAGESFSVASKVIGSADGARAKAYADSMEYSLVQTCISQLSSSIHQGRKSNIVFTRRLDSAGPLMHAFLLDVAQGGRGSSLTLQAQLTPGSMLSGDAFDSVVSVLTERLPNWRPMIELNFDELVPASGSSPQLCGTELYDICARAAKKNIRLTMRTDANIYNVDFGNLSYAFASSFAHTLGKETWSISSPAGAVVDLDPAVNQLIRIDGAPWPGYVNGRLFFPAGSHTIESYSRVGAWGKLIGDPLYISNFTGSIIDAAYTGLGLTLRYKARTESVLSLSRMPLRVTVDGIQPLSPYGFGRFPGGKAANPTFLLPAGDHRVRIVADSFVGAVTAWISVHLSVFIVMVSLCAVILFVVFYTFERVALRRKSSKQSKVRNDIAL